MEIMEVSVETCRLSMWKLVCSECLGRKIQIIVLLQNMTVSPLLVHASLSLFMVGCLRMINLSAYGQMDINCSNLQHVAVQYVLFTYGYKSFVANELSCDHNNLWCYGCKFL